MDCDDSSDEEECSTESSFVDRRSTTTGPIYTTTQRSVYDKTRPYPYDPYGGREDPRNYPDVPSRPGSDSNALGGSPNTGDQYPNPLQPSK